MTAEEKQKAIDALKISSPVRGITQEEFKDYCQTLNTIKDWLEKEPRTVTEFADKCRECGKMREGHWILADVEGSKVWYCRCSKCNEDPMRFVCGSENWWLVKTNLPIYCPSCGAKMVEPKLVIDHI